MNFIYFCFPDVDSPLAVPRALPIFMSINLMDTILGISNHRSSNNLVLTIYFWLSIIRSQIMPYFTIIRFTNLRRLLIYNWSQNPPKSLKTYD